MILISSGPPATARQRVSRQMGRATAVAYRVATHSGASSYTNSSSSTSSNGALMPAEQRQERQPGQGGGLPSPAAGALGRHCLGAELPGGSSLRGSHAVSSRSRRRHGGPNRRQRSSSHQRRSSTSRRSMMMLEEVSRHPRCAAACRCGARGAGGRQGCWAVAAAVLLTQGASCPLVRTRRKRRMRGSCWMLLQPWGSCLARR